MTEKQQVLVVDEEDVSMLVENKLKNHKDFEVVNEGDTDKAISRIQNDASIKVMCLEIHDHIDESSKLLIEKSLNLITEAVNKGIRVVLLSTYTNDQIETVKQANSILSGADYVSKNNYNDITSVLDKAA